MNQKRLISILKNLVRIDSSENCGKIADYVYNFLSEHGYKPRADASGNIIASIGKGEGFLLNAHLDTVPARGWKFNPFNPIVKNGRLYGRGATDCKSGVACMMETALNVDEKSLGKKLLFTFSTKEEDSSLKNNGSYMISKKIKAKNGLILEPSVHAADHSIGVVFGCKGIYRCDIEIIGKSAHSGFPWRGKNPISLLPDFIRGFDSMKKPAVKLSAYGEQFNLSSVASITQVKAAEGVNVIPGKCTITVDYRTIPQEKEKDVRKRIINVCEKSLDKYNIKNFRFYDSEYCLDEEFYGFCTKKIKAHGFGFNPKFSNGRNDLTIFKKYGNVNTFAIGPGTLGQLHRNPECVDLKSLLSVSKMIKDTVFTYCAKP